MNFTFRPTAGRAALCAVLFGGLLFLPSRSYELFPGLPTQANTSREGMSMSGRAGKTQAIYCGFWRTDNGFTSRILMVNSLVTGPLTVIPILYMADGTQYSLRPLMLPPQGISRVDVGEALASVPAALGPHLSEYGSAALKYLDPSPGELSGAMQILNVSESLSFDYPFDAVADATLSQHTLEGVWWKRDPGVRGFVSLANVTDMTKEVTYQAIGAVGGSLPPVTIELPAHSSRMLDLDLILAGVPPEKIMTGGIRIQYTGRLGEIMAGGGLEDDAVGFSDTISFMVHDAGDTNPVADVTYASAGVLVGGQPASLGLPQGTRFMPFAVLRNTTASPLPIRFMAHGMFNGQSRPHLLLARTLALRWKHDTVHHVPWPVGRLGSRCGQRGSHRKLRIPSHSPNRGTKLGQGDSLMVGG